MGAIKKLNKWANAQPIIIWMQCVWA